MAGYTIRSFGCRASSADGDGIAAALAARGLAPATSLASSELVVLNTCAVTAQAERDARAAIRQVRRQNPVARVVVTGCYAQRAPGEVAALEGVSAVVGNSHKSLAAEAAMGLLRSHAPAAGWVAAETLGAPRVLHAPFFSHSIGGEHAAAGQDALSLPVFAAPAGSTAARTRPVLRIQEGCGNRCSFCIIPETRGPSRSLPRREVLDAVQRYVEAGVQEFVLSGINLGRWGRDLGGRDSLAALVGALLEETRLPRLRLSSIEPMDWDDALLELFARHAAGPVPRLAPHAHLPLQSGSDAVLRRMHRRYRPWHYAEKLRRLHSTLPGAALGADVLVGFPGETDACFEETMAFVAAQPLTYLHLFPYSPRPGTAAAEWHRAATVAAGAVRERMRALEALGRAKHEAHMASFLGRTLSAVTLRGNRALTANFLPVRLAETFPPNRLLLLRAASIEDGVVTASAITPAEHWAEPGLRQMIC